MSSVICVLSVSRGGVKDLTPYYRPHLPYERCRIIRSVILPCDYNPFQRNFHPLVLGSTPL